MPYLGNTPTTQSFISGTDYFNGTGSQTAFTLSRTVASINDIQVTVNNVVQQPNDAYTISGTTLTMTSAPSSGTNNVYVRYLSTTTQAITPSQNTVSWNTLDSNIQQDLGVMYKNRIINGNMVIDQRNAGASVTAVNGAYSLDRWIASSATSSVFSIQQSTTAPAGFNNSLLVTSLASTSVTTNLFYSVQQIIEGYNVADLNWGGANAKTVTMSFWVRSSLTGTFSGCVQNSNVDRSYPFTYTISAANTWQQKSVTIPGDTTGTWNTTNNNGMFVLFSLGNGSARQGTANAWNSFNARAVSGETQVVATSGATWQVTGVQLEVGTQATTFTTAGGSYGAELALCQRYFWMIATGNNKVISNGFNFTASNMTSNIQHPVTMRTTPTIFQATGTNYFGFERNGASDTFNSLSVGSATNAMVSALFNNTEISGTAGDAGTVFLNNASAYLGLSAEL
jgi:hypothetical protein